jgi:adenylate kinase family enzyme
MKTIIIGNSGSGKTWLANRLAANTETPVIHLDELFWQPGGFDQKRPLSEVERLIEQSKERPSWIVEGVFGELAERYFDGADLLVWLDLPWDLCKARLLARNASSKTHMDREQSEAGLQALVEWASRYYERQNLRSAFSHHALLQRFPGKALRLRSEEAIHSMVTDMQRDAARDRA